MRWNDRSDMPSPELQLRRLGYALGAEVKGVELTCRQDEATIAAIRAALLEHVVLCFPGQDLSEDQLVAFSSRFGVLDDNRKSAANRHPQHAPLMVVSNKAISIGGKPGGGYRNGRKWHSDLSYTDRPSTLTFLVAKRLPSVGGETLFANMYRAYETLSPSMQRVVESLELVHDVSMQADFDKRTPEDQAERRRLNPPIVHPVVRVHPETGRKALYVGLRVRNFVGMTQEESSPILDFLNQHSVRYELTYRHRWTVGDLLIWDNRCAMHLAIQDYDQSELRHMMRASLLGPRIGRVYAAEEAGLAASPA